jgi:hypothetical protein
MRLHYEVRFWRRNEFWRCSLVNNTVCCGFVAVFEFISSHVSVRLGGELRSFSAAHLDGRTINVGVMKGFVPIALVARREFAHIIWHTLSYLRRQVCRLFWSVSYTAAISSSLSDL